MKAGSSDGRHREIPLTPKEMLARKKELEETKKDEKRLLRAMWGSQELSENTRPRTVPPSSSAHASEASFAHASEDEDVLSDAAAEDVSIDHDRSCVPSLTIKVSVTVPGQGVPREWLSRLNFVSKRHYGVDLDLRIESPPPGEDIKIGRVSISLREAVRIPWIENLLGQNLVNKNPYRSMKAVVSSILDGLTKNDHAGIAQELRVQARDEFITGLRGAQKLLKDSNSSMTSIPNLLFYEGVMVYAYLEGKEGKQLLREWLRNTNSSQELQQWTEDFWSDLTNFRTSRSWAWTPEHERKFWEATYWDKDHDRVIPQNFIVHEEEEDSEDSDSDDSEDSEDGEESDDEEMEHDLRFHED